MKKLFITFLVLGIAISYAAGQTKTIRGRIIYGQIEPVVYAYILINDSVKVGMSDLNGNFTAEIPTAEKKLLLLAVGFDGMLIGLTDKCDDLEIVMTQKVTPYFESRRKAEKFRKKKLLDAEVLHKSAYEKGIFKSSSPCYERLSFK